HSSGSTGTTDDGYCGWHEKNPRGGFGIVEPDEKGSCDISITLPDELPSAPGASGVDDCIGAMIGEISFVPIYDDSRLARSPGRYLIAEFAAIRVDFVGFGSAKSYGSGGCTGDRPSWTHQKQDYCLRGTFMGLVSVEDVVGQDLVVPGPEDTAVVARLID